VLLVSTDNLTPPETEDVRAKKEKINRRVTRDSALSGNAANGLANTPGPATPATEPANNTQTVKPAPAPETVPLTASKPISNEVKP